MSLATFVQASAHDLHMIAAGCVQAIVTSPPYYGLRAYAGEQSIEWPAVEYAPMPGLAVLNVPAMRASLGNEPTLEAYIGHLILCLREWRRVLRDDGIAFVNLGDSYATAGGSREYGSYDGANGRGPAVGGIRTAPNGLKPKDLMMVPARFALAAQADGWWLRSAVTWIKGNPMPESVRDRPTRATEMIYMLTKSANYFYDSEAVRVVSNGFNGGNGINEVSLKGWANGSTPLGITSKGSKIPLQNEFTPYLILSALFTAKRILVEQRNDDFGQILRVFQTPANRGIGFAILSRLLTVNPSTKILADIFQDIGVVITQGDLKGESVIAMLVRSLSEKGHDSPFAVKEASEVVTKIIANAQSIRDAIPFDALSKCFVDVDFVNQSVALLDTSEACSDLFGNGVITKSTLEQFLFELGLVSLEPCKSSVTHMSSGSDNVGGFANYSTQTPTGANMRDWMYVTSQPFSAAHFAVWPEAIPEKLIRAATKPDDIVLDPFSGSGTTAKVAVKLGRRAIGVDICAEYLDDVTALRFGEGVQMELTGL